MRHTLPPARVVTGKAAADVLQLGNVLANIVADCLGAAGTAKM